MPVNIYHNVPMLHKLHSGLKGQDVQNIDGITEVVNQQPHMDVIRCLIRKRPTHRNHPRIPVKGQRHTKQPKYIDQIYGEYRAM